MPGVAQAIALVVLVVLLLVLVTFAWRLSRWLFQTRQLLAFQLAVEDIVHRSEAALGPISEAVDAVRRGLRPGPEITGELGQAIAAADGFAAEARQLRPPREGREIVATMAAELERAGRAIAMVEHGCELSDVGSHREHDPEAQTSIKRGYLNLLHARESLAEQATAAAGLPIPGPRFLTQRVIREAREPRL